MSDGKRLYSSAEDAYQNDVTFKHVVDMLEMLIHRAEITPAEARAAAVLACIHYEMRTIRPLTLRVGPNSVAALADAEARIRALKRWIDEDGPKGDG